MLTAALSRTKATVTRVSEPADRFPTKDLVLEMLNNKSFTVMGEPYRHVIVDDIFPIELNRALNHFFKAALYKKGLRETDQREAFSRFGHYDAYGWNPDPRKEHPARVFFSTGWKDLFASLFEKKVTNDTIVGFHYHKPYSASGDVHSDYAACAFKYDPLKNHINPWYHHCKHQTDEEQPNTFRRVRAIAFIYYLSTERWFPEYGGETGLYETEDNEEPTKRIAPFNNRLLAFEVTPSSYHAFIQNKDFKRNCIVQWLHVTPETAIARYGITPHHMRDHEA